MPALQSGSGRSPVQPPDEPTVFSLYDWAPYIIGSDACPEPKRIITGQVNRGAGQRNEQPIRLEMKET